MRNSNTLGDIRRKARNVAEEQTTSMGNQSNRGRGRDERPPMEACPVDGSLKFVATKATKEEEGHALLLCRSDNDRFKKDRASAISAIAKSPETAPAPPSKVEWTLSQMLNLTVEQMRQAEPTELAETAKAVKVALESELDGLSAKYRGEWEEKVLPALATRGVVEGTVEWGEDDRTGLPRPSVRFTQEAYRSREGLELMQELQRQNLSSVYGEMRAVHGIISRFDEVVDLLVGKIFSGDAEDDAAEDTQTDEE